MSKQLKHNSKNEKKPINKKAIIIGVAAAVVCVVIAVILILVLNSGQKNGLKIPTKEQITADMQADEAITKLAVGKHTYDFTITELEKTDDKTLPKGDNPTKYNAWVTISRESEMYGIVPTDYKVSYKLNGKKLDYDSSEQLTKEISFTALKGVDKKTAEKKVKKCYKKVKFKSQKTNLKKGVDKLKFKVVDKELTGTVTAVYKFNNKKGWKFKKIDSKKLRFKKGITHKENGLYTNSAVKNILFLGIDADDGNGRSDCMMLISIDNNTGKIKQTSFMRDNWFSIPGYGKDKLNAAYVFGGPELTVKTISKTFGIKIDNYVVVDFSTFKQVINQLGGVDVNITPDEAGYINWQIKCNHQKSTIGYVSTKGGVTHLNGQQALWLCRDRGGGGYSGDDFMRTARQRKVIQALINTYKTYTPAKVLATINLLKGNVKTDLTASQFKWYAVHSPKFFTYKFRERCVPTAGEWQSGYSEGGAWIIKLNNFSKLKSEIQHDIYEDLK